MQLNISTDYAIRSLLYLATCGRQASSSEIAYEMCIPDNYLYAVMGKLKKAGLAVATRGVKGGWTLTKDPSEIALLDIIEVMEGSVKMNRCLDDSRKCNREATSHCSVHAYYSELQDQLESFLGNVTLEQLRDRSWRPLSELAVQNRAD
ncbi:MAG: RrF2 family transcriptional regulator [Coriobacteriales bacterium]|jgi:Rrf2 family protein